MEYISLRWSIYLSYGVYISQMEYISLRWSIYLSDGVYISQMEYISLIWSIYLSYGVYISHMIRYCAACCSYQDFVDWGLLLTIKLLNQGFLLVKLKSSLRTFYDRHHWPLWNICVTNDHGYVPLVANTSRYFPHSWLITGFVTRLTRRVSLVEQELLSLPEHSSSSPVNSGVRVTRSLVLYIYFVDRCLSFHTFSFCHCVVCSSSIYEFWLPLWYLQTLFSRVIIDKRVDIIIYIFLKLGLHDQVDRCITISISLTRSKNLPFLVWNKN
jgi:hypothetical protein